MSKKVEIDKDEQYLIRKKIDETIKKMKRQLSDAKVTAIIDRFKNIYNICETSYKCALQEYRKKLDKSIKEQDLKIDMREAPAVLKSIGYAFEKNFLKKLFGGNDKELVSLKKIRNNVTHGLNDKYIDILVKNEKEIFETMNNFIDTIEQEFATK